MCIFNPLNCMEQIITGHPLQVRDFDGYCRPVGDKGDLEAWVLMSDNPASLPW